ncbi:MAG: glutamine synthetase [Chloroflexi bacterium]|nr:glutamine synthetase [Chloroflexota bacterium]
MSRPDIAQRLKEQGIAQVRVVFLDYNGLARARSLAIDALPRALEQGVNFSTPTVDFNSRDLFPAAARFDPGSGDFFARPDPATYRPVPGGPGSGEMLADLVDAAGHPWGGCPRSALRRVVGDAAGRGLCFNVGFEPEGYVFRRDGAGLDFVAPPEFATLDGLDVQPDFMRELLADLADVGVTVEQWSKEYGPGQIEVNLRHSPPMAAADSLVRFRSTFRSVARRHGLLGTLMPKPFQQHAGSGLHVHLSASPPNDPDRNLFDDAADSEFALSALGRHALAGLLAHGAALTALGATTVNSYKRFLPGSWAPTHLTYGYASRAAFVRIPERETPRRLELRVGDGAGNPYIYLAGIVAAMLDGVERRLDPGPATPGDPAIEAARDPTLPEAHPIPPTLERALDHLERDDTLRAALGDLIFDEFVKVKRSEWDAFRLHVGDWDRDWYLDRY